MSILLVLVILTGCAVGPDYKEPAFQHNETWQSELLPDEQLISDSEGGWWLQFHDPLLSGLIEMGLHHNYDLKAASAHVEQARALRGAAAGSYFPTLDVKGSASRNRFSNQTGFGANTGIRNTFSAGLDTSWELDLFGRNRRKVEAADAEIGASRAIRDGVMLSVMAEIASTYFEVRGLQRQLVMTKHDIELLIEMEKIARAQADAGIVTEMDVARAAGERESFEARLPDMEAGIMARIYRLSVLTGKAPEYHIAGLETYEPLPMPTDRVPVGLRSELLKRRPDIQLAERQLAAATANIGIAKADLFPDFSLTGAVGSSARLFSDLFLPSTMTSSAGAVLGWPLFAGGSIMGRVDAAEAGEQAALAGYEQAVLLALEDTEGSLMRYGKQWQRLKRLRAAESSRNTAFEIAKARYEAGEESFLSMLDAERVLIATRNDIIDCETRILTSLTQLYKALGGGWQTNQ
jgi:multidrug efflux system outer membrane protein